MSTHDPKENTMTNETYQPGDRVRLTEDYMDWKKGQEFEVDEADPIGSGFPVFWPDEQILHGVVHGRRTAVFARRVERVSEPDASRMNEPWIRTAEGPTVLYDLPRLVKSLGIDLAESSTRTDMEHLRDALIYSIGTAVTDGRRSPLVGLSFPEDGAGLSVLTEDDEEPTPVSYPHPDGDTLVLGPGVFASTPGPAGNTVLNWNGVNFVPQSVDEETENGEPETYDGWAPFNRDAVVDPAEEGWHTAPLSSVEPLVKGTSALGLEIRVQTRPKR